MQGGMYTMDTYRSRPSTTIDGRSTETHKEAIMTTITTSRPAGMASLKQAIIRQPLVAFFILAFAISWTPVLPLALSRNIGVGMLPYEVPDALGLVLCLAASFIGPSLGAVIVLGVTEGRPGVMRLL